MSNHKYYVGIAACGCVRALLIDDEKTTAKEIADFARRQAQMKRRMEHRDGGDWAPKPGCEDHCQEARA